MQSAARSYFQTQVATTTQGDLVIMLYDAALKFLRQAKEMIAQKNYAQKGILISKALDILSELQGSLNAQKGGDLADRLQKLYFFCSARLLAANLKMDVAKIDEVMNIMTGLREAFAEANGKVATKTVPTSATQSTGRIAHAPISNPVVRPPYQKPVDATAPPAGPQGLVSRPIAAAAPSAPASPEALEASDTSDKPSQFTVEAVPPTASPAQESAAAPLRRIMAAYAAGRP